MRYGLGRAGMRLVLGVLGLWSAASGASANDVPHCALAIQEPSRAVVRVIDGETLALDDGSEVRLIGALIPRGFDAGAPEATWALEHRAKAELERLALGKAVGLRLAGRRNDRYGRLLAQVVVREGETRTWLQGEMLRSGHARAYGLPGSTDCLAELIAAEQQARAAGAGVWTHPSYQVRPAWRSWDLRRFRNTYQIVEGRIYRAASTRGHIYLNFGRNRRTDLTAIIRPAHKAAFDGAEVDVKTLQYRRVRVRGWIEQQSGLTIELYHPSQIELLDE